MRSRLGQNALYNMIYQVISIVVPLITSPYLARVVGADGIGQYAVTNSVANYFFIFAMLGVNNYGNRAIAQNKADRKSLSSTFWQIYYLQVICALIVGSLYGIFCIRFTSDEMRFMYMIQGIFVFSSITDINWFAFGMERFKTTTIRNIVVKAITTVSIFVFVNDANDVGIYTFVIHLGTVAGLLVIWPMIIKETDIEKPRLGEMLKHLKPNLVLFIPYLSGSIYHGMDKIMLGAFDNNAAAGYYTYSLNILNIPLGIITAVCTVFMPRIAYLVKQNEKENAFLLFEKGFLYMGIITIAMWFGVMAISPVFVPYYLGSGYQKTAEMLIILAFSIVLTGLADVLRSMYLIPYEKDKVYTISVITGTIVNFIGNLIAIPLLGGYGACWATVFAKVASLLVEIGMTFNELPYISWIKKMVPYLFLGGVMYIVAFAISNLNLHPLVLICLIVLVSVLLYMSGTILVLRFVEKDEYIKELLKKVRI